MIQELWKRIPKFRGYEVSTYGRVANVSNDLLLQPSKTLQGGLKVGLYQDGVQHTRSLKVLVAEAFVEHDIDPVSTDVPFDTPILLDGDQENCHATNILWRPRWFAWQYSRQFSNPSFMTDNPLYHKGPVIELDALGHVCGIHDSAWKIATTQGLLLHDVWTSINTRSVVFPTRQSFAFADKV